MKREMASTAAQLVLFAPVTESEILDALLNDYRVDIETGVIYSKTRKTPLSVKYGSRTEDRPSVRIHVRSQQIQIQISRIVWMVSRNSLIPKDFEVHHLDEDYTNNNHRNLICLHRDDHKYLHHLLEMEEVPY